jgi:hypothetical protein
MNAVCQKIEKHEQNVRFLCGKELNYAYFNKKLFSLVIIDNDNSLKKDLNQLKVPCANIVKYQRISKAKGIPVFIILHNEDLNLSINVKIINKAGSICCPFKTTKRQQQIINYIFDISKDKVIKQYSSI